MDDRREIDQRPFHPDRCRQLTRIRRIFESQGYTLSVFAELGAVCDGSRPLDSPLDMAALLRRTAQASPLNTLVRLFALARTVPEAAARVALDPLDLEELLAVGLLEWKDQRSKGR